MISNGSFPLGLCPFMVFQSNTSHSRLSVLSSAKMEFGLIPREHWFQPDSIDEEKATASRNKMMEDNIIYGGSVSYRNMCRFNSGVKKKVQRLRVRSVWCFFFSCQFFFKHPLMSKYRWYWRIEYVITHKFRLLNFSSSFIDLTSTFTVIFYVTRFYIWSSRTRFIVRTSDMPWFRP